MLHIYSDRYTMDIDIDFFSVFCKASRLPEISQCGFFLASHRASSLRDPRVTLKVQITEYPLLVFADVNRETLADCLATRGTHICLNPDEAVFCAEGKLPVGPWDLRDALIEAGCNNVICYQYGLKSRSREYWEFVDSLASDFPGCEENVFHISRMFDGIDEIGEHFLCLTKGETSPGYTYVQNFPLLKDLGNGFGSCIIDDHSRDATVACYARVVHVLKRHRLSYVEIPGNIAACRRLELRLIALRETLGVVEMNNLHVLRSCNRK